MGLLLFSNVGAIGVLAFIQKVQKYFIDIGQPKVVLETPMSNISLNINRAIEKLQKRPYGHPPLSQTHQKSSQFSQN